MSDRRFIEESFPVKEVGEVSAKEKNIRRGNISSLHIWWARRPLAASRATAYAALTPAPTSIEEWQKKRDFIIELSKWENSNNQQLLDRACQDILDANGGIPPKILDPFSGGGSYPLEALRLGCEAYANDYNPVAVLIEKATLEYSQKYGRSFAEMPDWAMTSSPSIFLNSGRIKKENTQPELFTKGVNETLNPLVEAVRYWSNWVLDETQKDLKKFFPMDPDGSNQVAYIWARTIICQNPVCRKEIPLVRSYWLAKKDKKRVAFFPDTRSGELVFRVVGDDYETWPGGFDPDKGNVSKAVVTCPICGTVIGDITTRRLFREKKSGHKLICVVLLHPKKKGKTYRPATDKDLIIFQMAGKTLEGKSASLTLEWGMNPIPDEETPEGKGSGAERAFSVRNYGMYQWGDLFNCRQLLSIITLIEKIRCAYDLMCSSTKNVGFVVAVTTYLALILSRHSSYNATLCWWEPLGERSFNVFGRQALPIVFDYSEQNPFGPLTGNFSLQTDITLEIIKQLSNFKNPKLPLQPITQLSATNLNYPNNYFDAILTDPPYYDNVPYSYLSDYFYVWLKRAIGHIYPDLFSTPLSPKNQEIVAYSNIPGGLKAGREFFEDNLKYAFQEMYRVLKPEGIAIIVYAHKSTSGWETLVNSLLDSKLVITGAWPLNTEMGTRLRANESAALASSIYIVARKTPRNHTGFFNEVREELRQYLGKKLDRLWGEGISGADFFIAAIGSAIEVFGKYEQVMDFEGNIVRADRLLDEVRTLATDYAVRQILHNGVAAEISDLSRFYILWRWNYCETQVPFDEARKLAQSCGIDLSQQWGKNGFIKKEKEFMRVLGPQNRKLDDLNDPHDLIDVLHKVLLLWEQSKRVEMIQSLAESGHGRSEAFFRVAQAISETLPNESKEKKLLDGFLAGRERVRQEVEKIGVQGRLWE